MNNNQKRAKTPLSIRWVVFQRDNFTCQYCGRSAPDVVLHVDHVIPVSRGGGDDLDNLRTACSACNIGKSDNEWAYFNALDEDVSSPLPKNIKVIFDYLSSVGEATVYDIANFTGMERTTVLNNIYRHEGTLWKKSRKDGKKHVYSLIMSSDEDIF